MGYHKEPSVPWGYCCRCLSSGPGGSWDPSPRQDSTVSSDSPVSCEYSVCHLC